MIYALTDKEKALFQAYDKNLAVSEDIFMKLMDTTIKGDYIAANQLGIESSAVRKESSLDAPKRCSAACRSA
ncbi:hypothetical protein JCM17380_38320 [Desulfosporosinus burensis]